MEAEGALNIGGSATESRNFSDEFRTFDDNSEEDITSRVGLFLRAKAPVSEKFSLFLRAGGGGRRSEFNFQGTRTSADGEVMPVSNNFNTSDFFLALGAGFEFYLNEDKRDAIRAAFTVYGVNDSSEKYPPLQIVCFPSLMFVGSNDSHFPRIPPKLIPYAW